MKIPADIPLDRAALLGCAVMTGVGAVFHTAAVEPMSTVVVVGCGGIGLSAVQGARIAGALRVIAVDRVAGKLEMARRLGATDVVDASVTDPVAAVRELTDGGADYTFEAIGLKTTAEQAFAMLRQGGTATVIGMVPIGVKLEIEGADFLAEKRLQGCLMGSNRFRVDMPRLLDLYGQGRLNLDDLVSARVPLEAVNDACRGARCRRGRPQRHCLRLTGPSAKTTRSSRWTTSGGRSSGSSSLRRPTHSPARAEGYALSPFANTAPSVPAISTA